MSHKLGKNSFKKYQFLTKIQNLPEMNQEFSAILYGSLSKNGAIQKVKTEKNNCPFFLF